MANGTQGMRRAFPVPQAFRSGEHAGTNPITVFRWRRPENDPLFPFLARNPLQRIPDHLLLGFNLNRIVQVLPGTSTATTVDGATRLHSACTWVEKLDHFSSGKPSALIHDAHPHAIPRSRERYEDRQPTLGSRHAIALRGESIDRKLQWRLIRERAL